MSTREQRRALFAARPIIGRVLDIEESINGIDAKILELQAQRRTLVEEMKGADLQLDREIEPITAARTVVPPPKAEEDDPPHPGDAVDGPSGP